MNDDLRDAAAELRAWAKGLYGSEAAVELLIRAFGGRFVMEDWPWVHVEDDGWRWVDWEAIPSSLGGFSVVNDGCS